MQSSDDARTMAMTCNQLANCSGFVPFVRPGVECADVLLYLNVVYCGLCAQSALYGHLDAGLVTKSGAARVYTKRPLVVASHPVPGPSGYWRLPLTDVDGRDLRKEAGTSMHRLVKACNNDTRCVGFNSNGWLKTSFQPCTCVAHTPPSTAPPPTL